MALIKKIKGIFPRFGKDVYLTECYRLYQKKQKYRVEKHQCFHNEYLW